MLRRRLLLGFLLLLAPAPAFAWSRLGHRLIARLAADYLSNDARKELYRLLGQSPEDASDWADSIRSVRRQTSPWHYINVPVTASVGDDWRQYCGDQGCLFTAIERFATMLGDRSRHDAERAEALRFLIHFIADLHQPLHVADRDDHGGNDLRVTWSGRDNNLHAVWDTRLIASTGLSEDEWFGRLRKTARAMDRKKVARSSILTWGAESHDMARDVAYAVPPSLELEGEYASIALPQVEARLAKAGIRLAHLLTDLLKK